VASAVPGALTLAHERGCPLTPSQHPLFTHGEPPFEWLPVQFCCQPWGRRSAVCWTPAIPESRLQGASVQRGSRLHLAVSQRTRPWVDFPFTLGAPGTQGYSGIHQIRGCSFVPLVSRNLQSQGLLFIYQFIGDTNICINYLMNLNKNNT